MPALTALRSLLRLLSLPLRATHALFDTVYKLTKFVLMLVVIAAVVFVVGFMHNLHHTLAAGDTPAADTNTPAGSTHSKHHAAKDPQGKLGHSHPSPIDPPALRDCLNREGAPAWGTSEYETHGDANAQRAVAFLVAGEHGERFPTHGVFIAVYPSPSSAAADDANVRFALAGSDPSARARMLAYFRPQQIANTIIWTAPQSTKSAPLRSLVEQCTASLGNG